MILSDIRLLVGVHLGEKGLPPTVIAPTLNILSLLDEELTLSGFTVSTTIEKEMERLKNAITLMNYDATEDDEDDPLDDPFEDIEEEDEEEEDDLALDELFEDEDDD